MKLGVRVALYVLLVLLAGYFFGQFRSAYQATAPIAATALETPGAEISTTNEPPADTNAPPVTAADSTNSASPATADAPSTNAPAAVTGGGTPPAPDAVPAQAPGARRSDSVRSLALFVLFFLGLGGLAAWDAAQYFGNRAGRAVMAEDWIERKDPEYEKAEEEWSKGNHLDAISLMREYLAKNPREQHVALRIAEIYEKDLGNYLAAALELQEVLTKRLPKERWGWTAIRLSNLYSGRLNQPDKALELLNRIVTQYPATAAAKKARARLGIPEPVETVAAAPAQDSTETEPAADFGETPSEELAPEPEPPPSNLPKGFRPKK